MAKGPKLDRQALHDQLLEDLKDWSADYIERAKKAADAIYKRLQNNTKTPISKIVRDALDKEGFRDDTADALTDVMVKAVARGYGALPSVMASTPATKAAMLSHRWDPSGLTLSQKLYRDYQHTLSTVTQAIQTSMKQGGDLQALSKKLYDDYGHGNIIDQAALPGYMAELKTKAQRVLSGQDLKDFKKAYSKANAHVKALKQGTPLKAAYRQMLDAAASGSAKHLERAVHVALEEKSRYHAERIARTECARAYYEGFRAKNDSDDNVVAYRWELSSAHGAAQHCDCEEHAEKDSYGLGPGVYPKNECPNLPSHPHCMCHLVEVYADEVPGYKRTEKAAGAPASRVEAGDVEEPERSKKELRPDKSLISIKPINRVLTNVTKERSRMMKRGQHSELDATLSKITSAAIGKLLAGDDVHMVTLVKKHTVEQILKSGRLKSLFETGYSGGLLGNLRKKYERGSMSISHNSDPAKRPVYGMLIQSKDGNDIQTQAIGRGRQYGNVAIVYKHDIKRYATMTGGDSLGCRKFLIPSPLLTPDVKSIDPEIVGHIADKANSGEKFTVDELTVKSGRVYYTEVQIHGSHATVDNIAEIIYPKGTRESEIPTEKLKENGVQWRIEQ